jgi:hypothetical protein
MVFHKLSNYTQQKADLRMMNGSRQQFSKKIKSSHIYQYNISFKITSVMQIFKWYLSISREESTHVVDYLCSFSLLSNFTLLFLVEMVLFVGKIFVSECFVTRRFIQIYLFWLLFRHENSLRNLIIFFRFAGSIHLPYLAFAV